MEPQSLHSKPKIEGGELFELIEGICEKYNFKSFN